MSSSNVTDREPYEKAAEAEANIPQQQKPVGGPPGGPPPNGGTTAWLQVLGGFFLFFNTWVCYRLFDKVVGRWATFLLPAFPDANQRASH